MLTYAYKNGRSPKSIGQGNSNLGTVRKWLLSCVQSKEVMISTFDLVVDWAYKNTMLLKLNLSLIEEIDSQIPR